MPRDRLTNPPISLSICEIQGSEPWSSYAGQIVTTRGVVTGHSRRGFFIQSPTAPVNPVPASTGLFVFSPELKLSPGNLVELTGRVVDYVAKEGDKPNTQLQLHDGTVVTQAREIREVIEPQWLDMEILCGPTEPIAQYLNSLEGMLVGIRQGATFVAPSNPHGDYVVIPDDWTGLRAVSGGVLIDPACPGRWLPSFRIIDYAAAPRLDVGAKLLSDVVGPLNYRAGAYQLASRDAIVHQPAPTRQPTTTRLVAQATSLTVMTVNSFNLDMQVERASRVANPHTDIDDDVGDQRFAALARAIVQSGHAPDIVALQEIQDDDGAEQTKTVSARRTYEGLTQAIVALGGPRYAWLDSPPLLDADGGQPGANIRCGFLFNPARVELVESVQRFGEGHRAFDQSRKPIIATFRLAGGKQTLTIINVHLASKRHQRSVFAAELPGFDPNHSQRVEQGEFIGHRLAELSDQDQAYYVTGDFNDFEFSETLKMIVGDHSSNLVEQLPPRERHDYNHRGQLQVLTHGIVGKPQLNQSAAEYEILHGNELTGVRPGDGGEKASDHAYVVARLQLAAS